MKDNNKNVRGTTPWLLFL